MKKMLILFANASLFSSCETDYYEGDERIIVEGIVISNNQPLANAKVEVYPTHFSPKNGVITVIDGSNNDGNYYYDTSSSDAIASIKTDKNGKISLSIPRNTSTNVFVITVASHNQFKKYGYISGYNTMNYYVNVGTLNF